MLVARDNFEAALTTLTEFNEFGLDTETTGLSQHDRLFSLIIACEKESFYFNFNPRSPLHLLSRERLQAFRFLFCRDAIWFIANAKFDLGMLAHEGLFLNGDVWCTQAQERVIQNNLYPFEKMSNLDNLAKKYLNEEKDDAVYTYIMKNKLFDRRIIPGKKKEIKDLHFDQVPIEIVEPYGSKDARLHLGVGKAQRERIKELDHVYKGNQWYGPISDISLNELRLTKTCAKMEQRGVMVYPDYIIEAKTYEERQIAQKKMDFWRLTGLEYQESSALFVRAFERLGLSYPLTEKGNPSFNKDVLETISNPVANQIKEIRTREKRVGTYYSSFLHLKGKDNIIHPTINQWGAETGRMSYSEPNLQNVPKKMKVAEDYEVRGCFGPRPGFCWVAVDYRQQELRLLFDFAKLRDLISRVNNGEDPHELTAAITGLSRDEAKTIAFGLIYGMGIDLLALSLGCSSEEAAKKKRMYFRALAGAKPFMKELDVAVKARRYIRNRYGRVCHLADLDFSYKMLNYLIQGTAADMCKVAMNRVDEAMRGMLSGLVIQVHDELIFEMHETELDFIPTICKIMEDAYIPLNGMRMATSVKYSWKSWSSREMKEGLPYENDRLAVR